MTTTTSSSKKKRSPFLEILFSYKNFSILYGIILFILLPLINIQKEVLRVSWDDIALAFVSAIIVPYFACGIIFSFLHNKRATDLYLSFPIRREKLLFSVFGAGYISVVVPYVINALLKVFVARNMSSDTRAWFMQIIAMVVIYSFIIMAICTLSAVLVGTKLEYFGYSAALCGSLTVILLVIYLFSTQLFGFVEDGIVSEAIMVSSPIANFIYTTENPNYAKTFAKIFSLVWLVIGVLVLFLSAKIFVRRKSEIAENSARNSFIGYVIRIIGAFCGGVALYAISLVTNVNSILMAAIGGFLGYIVFDIIFKKGFVGVKRALIPSILCAILMAGFGGFFAGGGFGFETKVPKANEVKSAELRLPSQFGLYKPYVTLTEKEDIEKLTRLHQLYVTCNEEYIESIGGRKNYSNSYYRGYDNGIFNFKLKYDLGTSKLARQYSRIHYGSHYGEIVEAVNDLLGIREIKENSDAIFLVDYKEISAVEISNKFGSYKRALALNDGDGQRLVEAIRKDILNRDYNEIATSPQNDLAIITIEVKDDIIMSKNKYNDEDRYIAFEDYDEHNLTYTYAISDKDTETISVLKDTGYFDVAQKPLENIEIVILGDAFNGSRFDTITNSVYSSREARTAEYPTNVDYLTTTDKETINELAKKAELRSISSPSLESSTVKVKFITENGLGYELNLRIKDIPKEIIDRYSEMFRGDEVAITALAEFFETHPDMLGADIYWITDILIQSYENEGLGDTINYNAIIELRDKMQKDMNEETGAYYGNCAGYMAYLVAKSL